MGKYTEQDPLHHAVEQNQLDHVRSLLRSGLKPDQRDLHKRTPLMVAAKNDCREIATELIEHGADVNAKDARSSVWDGRWTALHYACQYNHVEMVDLLISKGADPDAWTQSWDTPLSSALLGGGRRMVDRLLQRGANPNGPEKCDMPPVVAAAFKNDPFRVAELLERGAGPNRIGGNGMSALGMTKSLECTIELLKRGADPNLKDRSGSAPLHHNFLVASRELIELLIRSGANVNLRCDGGASLLHLLAVRPRIDVAEIFIRAGADVNALNDEDMTPLDICSVMKPDNSHDERQRVMKLLQENGGKRATDL